VFYLLTDLQLREAIVACDDAITQLHVRDGELSRARTEVDKLEERIAGLETEVASSRVEANGALSHAKVVGRSYQIRKDEVTELEAKYKAVVDEVAQVKSEKEAEIADLKDQLKAESRKVPF
jgi:transcription elongation factor Elf1